MFDVVWANPNRELVGQRKARKEKEKEQKDTCSSGRSIASAETETSSLRSRKPQSFLESIRLKKKKPKQDAPSVSTSSRLSAFSNTAGNRDSVLAPPSLASSLGRSASVQYRDSTGDGSGSIGSGPSSSQNRSSLDVDSILSKWTIPNSLATMLSVDEDTELELRTKNGKKTTLIKTTGSDIVQTVLRLRGDSGQEVTTPGSRYVGHDRFESDIPQVPPLTPMASPQKSLQSPLTPSSLASSRRKKKRKNPDLKLQARHTVGKPPDSYVVPPDVPAIRPLSVRSAATSWNPRSSWENISLPNITFPAPLKVGIKTPRSPKSPANTIRSSSGAATEDTSPSSVAGQEDEGFNSLSLNLSGMQREILQMASADPETFWKRLTEQWGSWADAALYKELEMERKRWLLSALYSINPVPDTGVVKITGVDRRILAFFETQATASYIAALNASAPVHHMSPSPLSNTLFPNVAPILSPAMSCTPLSASPQAFSDIYAQPLPALVSASDIPLVLRNMHRALKPQGALHLLLIDPAPARSVTGPKLQAWLDEHLLLNLERRFRCTSPTRLFPTWLRDAHFQLGAGAKVVCQFPAVFKEGEEKDEKKETDEKPQPEPEPEPTVQTEKSTQESTSQPPPEQPLPPPPPDNYGRLRCLVGQKLWQEIWGPHVTARNWWWEDEACREECLRLGTVWEYHIVDAVKKERYVASQS